MSKKNNAKPSRKKAKPNGNHAERRKFERQQGLPPKPVKYSQKPQQKAALDTTICQTWSAKQELILNWWKDPAYKDTRYILAEGSMRSGKTSAMFLSFIQWSQKCYNNRDFILAGKTGVSAERAMIYPNLPMLESYHIKYRYYSGRKFLQIGTNRYHIIGGANESAQYKVQGMTCGGVFYDEATLIHKTFVEMANSRCSLPGARIWFNCNPDSPTHWIKRDFIDAPDTKRVLKMHFQMSDNPSLNPDSVALLKEQFSGRRYERYILGHWVGVEQGVYPMFDALLHLTNEDLETGTRWFASVDYGFNNPTSIGLWTIRDDIYYRVREFYYKSQDHDGQGLTHDKVVDALDNLRGEHALEYVVYDPSCAALGKVLRNRGYKAHPADNRVKEGIAYVQRLFEQGKVKISQCCKDFVNEINSYKYKQDTDIIIKKDDHAMDEMRYFLFSRRPEAQPALIAEYRPRDIPLPPSAPPGSTTPGDFLNENIFDRPYNHTVSGNGGIHCHPDD
jgi:PBSX family phage terminase large subunit